MVEKNLENVCVEIKKNCFEKNSLKYFMFFFGFLLVLNDFDILLFRKVKYQNR